MRDGSRRAFQIGGFVPVCPECECGLGCPRVAMDLYRDEGSDDIRMTAKDGMEHAPQMREWIARKLPELKDFLNK